MRDFTFIDDIVAANVLAAASDVPAGSVFNVAGGSNVTVNETLATLTRLAGHPLRVKYIDRVAGDDHGLERFQQEHDHGDRPRRVRQRHS